MNYFEREELAEQHAREAVAIAEPDQRGLELAAILEAVLALTHATLAVAARTGHGHCSNCCME